MHELVTKADPEYLNSCLELIELFLASPESYQAKSEFVRNSVWRFIPEGIDACIQRGASEVIILLNFLNSGRHVNEDIPKIVEDAKARYSNVHFSITTPVGQHSQIAELFTDLIKHV